MAQQPRHKIDPAVCPLCGGPNDCAMAADPNAAECWCGKLKFPQELLDRVPENALNQACICRGCLERFMMERQAADDVIEDPPTN
jgi:hypothetical protein